MNHLKTGWRIAKVIIFVLFCLNYALQNIKNAMTNFSRENIMTFITLISFFKYYLHINISFLIFNFTNSHEYKLEACIVGFIYLVRSFNF